jgi:hypothetical protein
LETDKPRYSSGEEVDLQAKALDPSYAPEPDVEIEWTLRKVALGNARDSGELRDDAWKTDALGKAGEKLAELPVGAYEVTARRRVEASGSEADGGGSHEVRRVFIVEPAGNELAYVDADPGIGRLQRLAERSGGEALSAVEGDDLPEELPLADPRERPGARAYAASYGRTVALWDGWAALALVVFGLGGEWLLRRRVGLR